jgi:molybdopterin molybdotransferase
VILTGGVSMGDYDYVPDVVREVGGEIVFHGLPLRPGKPILGAATSIGKLIVGLPGNPVSATVGCRRMVLPLLAKMSGQINWLPPRPMLRLLGGGDKAIPLHWMRLVRLTGDGVCEPVLSQGSGDLVSLGNSDGFVETPPGAVGEGPWPYYSW